MSRAGGAITLNLEGVEGVKRDLKRLTRAFPTATAQGINRSLVTARKRISVDVRKHMNIKASSAKSRIKTAQKARANRTSRTVSPARIEIKEKRRPNVASFKTTRQVKRGVSVRFKPYGPREVIETGYLLRKGRKRVAITKYGEIGPKPRPGSRLYKHKAPAGGQYRAIRGPSVAGVFIGSPGLATQSLKGISEVVIKRVHERIRFHILKRRGLIPKR